MIRTLIGWYVGGKMGGCDGGRMARLTTGRREGRNDAELRVAFVSPTSKGVYG